MAYAYDAWGNRVSRTGWDGVTTTTERFAVDGWDTAKPGAVGTENFDIWADLDTSNTVTSRRLFGAGFDDPEARVAGSAVTWYAADLTGSVRRALDGARAVTHSAAYDAFGNLTSGTLPDRYGYAGREWDPVSKTYFNRDRVYDPAVGRFLSEDPEGLAADPNPYRYVRNRPTTATDPSGRYWFVDRPGDYDKFEAFLRANGVRFKFYEQEGRGRYYWIDPADSDRFRDAWVRAGASPEFADQVTGAAFDRTGRDNLAMGGDPAGEWFHDPKGSVAGSARVARWMAEWDAEARARDGIGKGGQPPGPGDRKAPYTTLSGGPVYDLPPPPVEWPAPEYDPFLDAPRPGLGYVPPPGYPNLNYAPGFFPDPIFGDYGQQDLGGNPDGWLIPGMVPDSVGGPRPAPPGYVCPDPGKGGSKPYGRPLTFRDLLPHAGGLAGGVGGLGARGLYGRVHRPPAPGMARGVPGLGCFAAGTPIRTPVGSRPVEVFTPGDLVLIPSCSEPL